MSATKFMLGPADSNPVEIIDILNAAYQSASIRCTGRVDIKLEDSPSDASAITGQKGKSRVFSITVEEVQ